MDIFFDLFLFSVVFCFGCCLQYQPDQKSSHFDRWSDGVKRAFSPEYDPETTPIPVAIGVYSPSAVSPQFCPSQSSQPPQSLRELRDFIRKQNLQARVREKLGKSVSSCTKAELLSVLNF